MAADVKRPYNSPQRRRQAEATRLQIIGAAQELFERDGYVATSMAAVARRAGVSLKTVYLAFDTKPGLLRAVWHRLLRGEQDGVPVGEQAAYRAVLEEPDAVTKLQRLAANSRVVKERAGALLEVIRSAATSDPDIGELWQRIQSDFRANQLVVVQTLDAAGALREGLDVQDAADILWAINHPGTYHLLVGERGWDIDHFEQWLARTFCEQLLGP